MSTYIPEAPLENLTRGTVFAALAIPVGIVAWTILWSIGFIASIVSFGVAYLAVFLYRFGSGGRITRSGAIRVTAIVLVTVVVSIVVGLVVDVARGISAGAHVTLVDALFHPRFGEIFSAYVSGADGQFWFSIVLALAFGVVGCFSILRGAFREARVTELPAQPVQPSVATEDEQPKPGA